MPKGRRATPTPGVKAEQPQKSKKKHQLRQPRPGRRRRKQDLRISQLILQALSVRKQRGGLSLASLREVLLANGYDVELDKARLDKVVKGLVSSGSLVQTKGGKRTSDSFDLSKRQRRQQKEAATETKAKKGTKKQKPNGQKKRKTQNRKKKLKTKWPSE